MATSGEMPPEAMINVEEALGEVQPWNSENAASSTIRARFKDHMQPKLWSGFLVDSVDLALEPGAAAVATTVTLRS